jgi:hypothetical protein
MLGYPAVIIQWAQGSITTSDSCIAKISRQEKVKCEVTGFNKTIFNFFLPLLMVRFDFSHL